MRMLHSSAVSALIEEELKSLEALEGGTATLRCQLSREAPVEWRKGHTVLRPSNKYRMRQEGTVAELLIHDVDTKDAGDYTCVVGSQKTTAALSVNGKKSEITHETGTFLSIPSLLLSLHSLSAPTFMSCIYFCHLSVFSCCCVTSFPNPCPRSVFIMPHIACVFVVMSSQRPFSSEGCWHACMLS